MDSLKNKLQLEQRERCYSVIREITERVSKKYPNVFYEISQDDKGTGVEFNVIPDSRYNTGEVKDYVAQTITRILAVDGDIEVPIYLAPLQAMTRTLRG